MNLTTFSVKLHQTESEPPIVTLENYANKNIRESPFIKATPHYLTWLTGRTRETSISLQEAPL